MARVLGAFGLYSLASLLLFGRDVVGAPTTRVVGDSSGDKTLYMWSFEWWPWAIAHGRNPLDVNVAWAPHGFDFGLGTAGGGLALLAAPLTALVGLVPTYNILILLAPALAATAAFVLADRFTGDMAASLVAGYVFGFSSYQQGRILGHLPLAFVVLVPLVAYLIVRRQQSDLSRPFFVGLLALALAVQFMIVTQVFFSLIVMGGVALAAAVPTLGWRTVRQTAVESGVALALALVLLSPVLLYAFLSDAAAPVRSPLAESADLLNYVVPTRRTWLRPPGAESITSRFTATGAEQGAYLGLPVPDPRAPRLRETAARPTEAPALAAHGRRRPALARWAGEGRRSHSPPGAHPWSLLARLPLVGSALPVRLTVYVALGAGMLVALALADRRTTIRWLLVAVGIVATVPNVSQAQWSSHVPRPKYFAARGYQQTLAPGSTVLVLPYGPAGWSMLWHAESTFRFRLIGGHFALRTTPKEEKWRDVYESLGSGTVEPARFRAFLLAHGVDAVVVAPRTLWRMREVVRQAVGLHREDGRRPRLPSSPAQSAVGPAVLDLLPELVLVAVASGLVLVGALELARRLGIETSFDLLVAAPIVAAAQLVVTLLAAGLVHRFDRTTVVALNALMTLPLATLARRRLGAGVSLAPARRALSVLRGDIVATVLVGVAAVSLLWRVLLALALPPYGYDAVSYHLPTVIEWIQQARLVNSPFNTCCAYYPANGELLAAWPTLLTHDLYLADVAQCTAAMVGALAVAGIARICGLPGVSASIAGSLFVLTPVILAQANTAYVDVTFTATLLAAYYLTLRGMESRDANRVPCLRSPVWRRGCAWERNRRASWPSASCSSPRSCGQGCAVAGR